MNDINLLAIRNGLVQKREIVINRVFIFTCLTTILIITNPMLNNKYVAINIILDIISVILGIATIYYVLLVGTLMQNIKNFDKLYLEDKNAETIIKELGLLPQKE